MQSNALICDGWIALLIFLPHDELAAFSVQAGANKAIQLVVTTRDIESIVKSELHHWVRHDLESKANLSFVDRSNLEMLLRTRSQAHARRVKSFVEYCEARPDEKMYLTLLPLEKVKTWPDTITALLGLDKKVVSDALHKTGARNQNPPLPIQGVLLTFRISSEQGKAGVELLLLQLEEDSLCEYLLVIAIDQDEADTTQATAFLQALQTKHQSRLQGRLHVLQNPHPVDPDETFPVCQVWHAMAGTAWKEGASWVVLLGDDVSVECPVHYRVIYRSFLSLHEIVKLHLWFGCPWFNDVKFPGFPTFPVVGAEHYKVFGALIPSHRIQNFCNQDLDPYLRRLYLKFGASPWMEISRLTNHQGGTDTCKARYKRKSAIGWRDWVLEDTCLVEQHLQTQMRQALPTKLLLDVVIPAYRLNLEYVERICSLPVPSEMRTTFIIIVDNPDFLVALAPVSGSRAERLTQASRYVEDHLVSKSGESGNANNICVRCNKGASSSRNRGLDESAAEHVLFLDDDVIPRSNLLSEYEKHLKLIAGDTSVKGLVGLVEFPRCPDMPVKHAAVLMSYLTFMFEIAPNPAYSEPAWGVTANLLVVRTPNLRFDTDYAKSGGGEDVDFCLRLLADGQEVKGRLISCPNAVVHHEFWSGSILDLASHFFNWATGDSALFSRFPGYCYRSWPNVAEMAIVLFVPWLLYVGPTVVALCQFVGLVLSFVVADVCVDIAQRKKFLHRCQLLHFDRPLWFCVVSHLLANVYVIVLEKGRLMGHARCFQLPSHFSKRFDWHCGRLPQSKRNFRQVELNKFVLFLALTVGFASRLMTTREVIGKT